jgi:hypothetical protein
MVVTRFSSEMILAIELQLRFLCSFFFDAWQLAANAAVFFARH